MPGVGDICGLSSAVACRRIVLENSNGIGGFSSCGFPADHHDGGVVRENRKAIVRFSICGVLADHHVKYLSLDAALNQRPDISSIPCV